MTPPETPDSRFKSIGGILERKERPRQQDSATVTVTSSVGDPAGVLEDTTVEGDTARTVPPRTQRTATSAQAEPATKSRRTRASDTADGGARRVAVRLNPELHQQLLQARDAQHLPNIAEVVLAALERLHSHGDLASHVAARDDTNQLFPRLPSRESAQPKVLVELRLHDKALVSLDQLVVESGARTRTELIIAALRADLQPHADQAVVASP